MNQHFRPLHQFQVVRFFAIAMITETVMSGNSRVSAGYYEFYYICWRWYFRTNEHIAKAIKVLVTY